MEYIHSSARHTGEERLAKGQLAHHTILTGDTP